MLGISPFSYGVQLVQIYEEGSVFAPKILDITESDLIEKFMLGVSKVAAVSLAIGYPNSASVPHMLVNGYKNVLAIALATEITFPLVCCSLSFVYHLCSQLVLGREG